MTAKPCIDAPITDPMFNETDHPFLGPSGRVLALTRAGLAPVGSDQLILTHPPTFQTVSSPA
jgi:hypothetical protein